MLPLRVEIEGFLTYRDKEVFDFSQEWLWAITGDNGAGKSAIFDAITFVLYGEHRGGQSQEAMLINQDRDYLRVAFDFQIGSEIYRVERTITRRRGRRNVSYDKTYQVYLADPKRPQVTHWMPIPGTDAISGLENWVKRSIGLGYEAFASSILLRQGEADRFIKAKPAARKTILMQMLDLAPYEQLELAAKKHRDEWDRTVKHLQAGLAPLNEVTAKAVEEAEIQRESLRSLVKAAQDQIDAANKMADNARQYTQLMGELQQTRTQLEEAAKVIQEANTIENSWNELCGLRHALPVLGQIVEHREREATARSAAARIHQQLAGIDLAHLDAMYRDKTAASAQKEKAYNGVREAVAAARKSESELQPLADAGKELIALQEEKANVEGQVSQIVGLLVGQLDAQERLKKCDAADRSLAHLRELKEQRQTLRDARQKQKEAADKLPHLQDRLKDLVDRLEALRQRQKNVLASKNNAHLQVAGLNAELRKVSEELRGRRDAQREITCSRCGQPIDQAHIHREIEDTQRRLDDLTRDIAAYEKQIRAADHEEARLADSMSQLSKQQDSIANSIRQLENAVQIQSERYERAQRQIEIIIDNLPQPYSSLSSDEGFPSDQDIKTAEKLALDLPQAQQECKRLDRLVERATLLRQQNEARNQRIQELTEQYPGKDFHAIRLKYDETVSYRQRQEEIESALWQQWQTAKTEADKASAALDDAKKSQTNLEELAKTKESEAESEENTASALAGTLGDDWRHVTSSINAVELRKLQQRADELAWAELRKQKLDEARMNCHALKEKESWLDQAISEIPVAHRIPIPAALETVEKAERLRDALHKEFEEALGRANTLLRQLEDRQSLEMQLKEASTKHDDYASLVKLLGKEGLQAWLVETAQEAICRAANEFLSHISGGSLELDMVRKGDDLGIIVRDFSSGREPMDIKFISGSQHFRAAVALALAIGRYSGGGSRCIRSIIIDEGFGSLDKNGQREMIAQLKGLDGILDRVILVSHQEVFHDAFPNGYHIEKRDGASHGQLRSGDASALNGGRQDVVLQEL